MCIVGSESDFSQFKSSRSFLSFFCGVRAQWPKVSCLSSWESILILALSNIAVIKTLFETRSGKLFRVHRRRHGLSTAAWLTEMFFTRTRRTQHSRPWTAGNTDTGYVMDSATVAPYGSFLSAGSSWNSTLKRETGHTSPVGGLLGWKIFQFKSRIRRFSKARSDRLDDRFSRYQLSERRSGKTAREEVPCMQVATTNMSVWSSLYLQIRYKPPFSGL